MEGVLPVLHLGRRSSGRLHPRQAPAVYSWVKTAMAYTVYRVLCSDHHHHHPAIPGAGEVAGAHPRRGRPKQRPPPAGAGGAGGGWPREASRLFYVYFTAVCA